MPALKTFIVEDSPVIRENLVAALEEMTPITVVGTAEDEATARAWFEVETHDCDLVIIDIFLRKGSGLGVLQGLAATSRSCKRVVLSNFATPDMRRRCLDLGADKVFDKSNEIDALISYCIRLSEGGGETEPGALRELS
jgi:DNA-binding NarL/FixJ family response regulator